MKRREDLANPRYRRKLNVPYEPEIGRAHV